MSQWFNQRSKTTRTGQMKIENCSQISQRVQDPTRPSPWIPLKNPDTSDEVAQSVWRQE